MLQKKNGNKEQIQKNSVKNELDKIYDHIAEGTRIRSKCDWYEHGKKSTKFFLNLEKQRGFQNTIKNLLMIKKLQTKHIFQNISENFKKLLNTATKN